MQGQPPAGGRLAARLAGLHGAARTRLLVLAAVVAVATGIADRLTGPDLSLLLFYLIPVAIVAWVCSAPVAVAVALLVSFEGILVAVVAPDGAPDGVQLWNASARTLFYLLVVVLVGGQRQLLDALAERASTDPLTGALNRAALYDATERALSRARRTGDWITVAYFDLDGLKTVNDHQGHEAGDAIIVRAARATTEVLRREDLFARLGGDEFVIVLPGADAAAAHDIIARLEAAMARPVDGGPVRASIGVWTEHAPTGDPESLVHAADQLMYEAKRTPEISVRYRRPTEAPRPSAQQ